MTITNLVKSSTRLLAAAILCFVLAPNAQAAVPKLMTYQGVLKDSAGNFLTGTYSIAFRLYSASTGGTALWTETQSNVATTSGKFSVQLGSVTALSLDFNADYWLSIQVGADAEMTPRVRLTSVGYGIRSDYENNGFNQTTHDAMTHKDIEGVKDNMVQLAKTNFKLDAYTAATANSMGDLIIDALKDSTGIDAAASSNYTYRGGSDDDVIVALTGGDVIEESTTEVASQIMLSGVVPASDNGIGQLFQLSSAATVDKVAFKWQRYASPSGNVRVKIYSVSSGLPNTLLAESANIPVTDAPLHTSSYEDLVVTFATPVSLQASTDYIVCVEDYDGSGNGSNYIRFRYTSSDVYASGNRVNKNSSNNWVTASGDYYFKIYEEQAQSGTANVVSYSYAESSPNEALVVADETLGTGTITYYVSRDNGTTWTECTKETVTDISSQPTGTQFKWKAAITGDAELNAIAVAL